ncbi:hypothetical protein AAC387_Pa12g0523 [Persea americana]
MKGASSDSLYSDLLEAKALLPDRLKQKETHWRQKSRICWLQEGDKSSKFFHAYAKARGVSNRIDKISSNGDWIEDPVQIQLLAVSHFSTIAQSSHPYPEDILFQLDSRKYLQIRTSL